MSRATTTASVLGLLLAAAPHGGTAADVVVYRCVAADGAVTLQNDRRCPKGSREQRRVLEAPAARVAPPARPAAASMSGPAPAPVVALPVDPTPVVEVPRSAPPALFACRTWEGTRYFGDAQQPAARCAPLATVGLDGRESAAVQACEVVADTCDPVPETARCEAWAERLRAAEDAARFGDATAAPAGEAEARRIRELLAGSTCVR